MEQVFGVDMYNKSITGNVSKTMTGSATDSDHIPCVTYTLQIRSGCAGGGKGALIQENKSATLSQTLLCNVTQSLFVPHEMQDGILYLVRKLTPTECASLQGFPKDWCALVPHKDTPEYKMWGNGMALPCVRYVMEGMAAELKKRKLNQLFEG